MQVMVVTIQTNIMKTVISEMLLVVTCCCVATGFSPIQTVNPVSGKSFALHESGRFIDAGYNNDANGISSSLRGDGNSNNESTGEAILRLGSKTGPTVWTEFSRLSREHEVANLGQGFPDWLPPQFAIDALVEAVLDSAQSPHQYTRTAGHPNLVKQLAGRYSIHMKREIQPMSEVAVTVGASQALYLSLQTLIRPGMFHSFQRQVSNHCNTDLS
jgi:hypothetical protein